MVKKGRKLTTYKRGRLSKKGGFKQFLRPLLACAVIVVALVVGERLGLLPVNWDEVYKRVALIVKESLYTIYRPMKPAVEPVRGDWYTLYFTTPRYPDNVSTRIHIIEEGLIAAIDGAERSLDIAIYELDLDTIGDAILAARDRDVVVRVVTDSDSLGENQTLKRLTREGIHIVPDERSAIMHNKFVVIDKQAVWTGSWNFTQNGTFRHNNNAIIIQSETLARAYTGEFEEMFIRKEFGPASPQNTAHRPVQLGDTLIETCFAPEDECALQLVDLLQHAQHSIRFMAFSFTHDGFGNTIRQKAQAGVTVQGVFETTGSDTEHSEFSSMKREKLDVLQDGNPYILHHKVFIVDENIVVLGSFNFSDSADSSNDENILVLHNADIAKEFLAEFERVYRDAGGTRKAQGQAF